MLCFVLRNKELQKVPVYFHKIPIDLVKIQNLSSCCFNLYKIIFIKNVHKNFTKFMFTQLSSTEKLH